ncbi:MAG: ribonuclease H-like domain-containing protein [Candidatus Poribacteria bacterium]|nr:ribonuclease H-like domain-containing protein [Candidatus Poribacteria bacterium]
MGVVREAANRRVDLRKRIQVMGTMIDGILYFDIETKKLAHEVGGWENIAGMGISVATSYDSGTGEFNSFEESEISGLVEQILGAGLVVGYNQLRFDYRVLSAYSNADFWALPNFDMLAAVKATLGHRLKLDHIVKATLRTKKTGDGTQAVQWFRNGEIERVIEYCMNDTKVTRELFAHGCKKGYMDYYDTQHAHWPTVRIDTRHWRETVEYLASSAKGVESEPIVGTMRYLEVVRVGV